MRCLTSVVTQSPVARVRSYCVLEGRVPSGHNTYTCSLDQSAGAGAGDNQRHLLQNKSELVSLLSVAVRMVCALTILDMTDLGSPGQEMISIHSSVLWCLLSHSVYR